MLFLLEMRTFVSYMCSVNNDHPNLIYITLKLRACISGKSLLSMLQLLHYYNNWNIIICIMLCTAYVLDELATAIRNSTDIHFGLYYSLFEWFHPLYLQDQANKFQTDTYVTVCLLLL